MELQFEYCFISFVKSQRSTMKLENCITPLPEFTSCCVRNIHYFTVDKFQSKFSTGIWEDIFEGFDTNVTFNNILNIRL
jgi:hypothetical protein